MALGMPLLLGHLLSDSHSSDELNIRTIFHHMECKLEFCVLLHIAYAEVVLLLQVTFGIHTPDLFEDEVRLHLV
mgnify:CR=1 FL=1